MNTTTASLGQDTAAVPAMGPMEAAWICGNPLWDEPDPVVVGALIRFGLVGLVVCAVLAGLGRWWSSMTRAGATDILATGALRPPGD
jgi:hypothetical protein